MIDRKSDIKRIENHFQKGAYRKPLIFNHSLIKNNMHEKFKI